MEFGRLGRQMEIEPTANKGFILRVGCAVLVFTDYQDLLDALAEYWSDPEAVEKKYNEIGHPIPPPDRLRADYYRTPITRAFNEGFDPSPICEGEERR